jgi:Ca2+/Na+ antiporter
MFKRFYFLTFFFSILWICGLTFIVVWMCTTIGRVAGISDAIMGTVM